ncbi:MAG TPA: peptidylprolyl isomerase [Blastocatellia bacterium]
MSRQVHRSYRFAHRGPAPAARLFVSLLLLLICGWTPYNSTAVRALAAARHAGAANSNAITGSWAAPQSDSTDYDSLEAVLDTDKGQIVIQFFAKDAPRHVEYFVKQAREGAYDGTTFHRLYKDALIQGGDPLTKHAANQARFGTGGLNAGIPDEINKNKNIAGAVSAVLSQVRANVSEVAPGSSGAQFFILIAPGPKLDSQFTVFGHVVSGMDVVAGISTEPTGANNMASRRIAINKVTIREKSPTVEQMKTMSATLETSLGNVKVQFDPESAPETTRTFINYSKERIFDGTTFFRVSQKYYLECGNLADWPQDSPNRNRFFSLWQLPFEPNQTKPVRGTLSMRQINGSTSWDFYIISKDNPGLQGKDVPIGKVVEGLDVIDKIAGVDVEGDKPKDRIEIKRITIQ